MKPIPDFIRDEYGATAIEYAFLASLISMAAIVAMTAIGTSLSSTLSEVAASL